MALSPLAPVFFSRANCAMALRASSFTTSSTCQRQIIHQGNKEQLKRKVSRQIGKEINKLSNKHALFSQSTTEQIKDNKTIGPLPSFAKFVPTKKKKKKKMVWWQKDGFSPDTIIILIIFTSSGMIRNFNKT